MIEHKQLFLHKPEEGIIGDCFRTCVACLLDKRPDELPHGFGKFWEGRDVNVTPKVNAQLNNILANWDCRFIAYPLDCTREQLGTYLRHYYTDLHVIIGCNSKNGGHSVVMRNDDYIWDPSIDNSGCVGPMDDGYYWVGMLVRLT
jgi:hypothetical protein